MLRLSLVLTIASIGCYTGAAATRDVNVAWEGHPRVEIESRWGPAIATTADAGATALHWSHTTLNASLPEGRAAVSIGPNELDAAAAFRPGEVWHSTTFVAALVSPTANTTGTIARVEGPSLRWGPPNDANLHWGTILGAHVGLGRLDTTSTPLPSGGVYIGGMLGPQLGLVGSFSLVAGKADAGSAMAFAWGVGVQWWPVTRLALRAGPALVLGFDPGFNNAALHPGITTDASIAVVKVGTFVLDLRLDTTFGSSYAFGSLGVGANLN